MNWFTFLSLLTLSAFVLANGLAFERAGKEWAGKIHEVLKTNPVESGSPTSFLLPMQIQSALVPPCVTFWSWFGLLSIAGTLLAGAIYLGWHSIVVGVVVTWIASRTARGVWPKPVSKLYFATFHECLLWRMTSCQSTGDQKRAHWHACLIVIMEQIEKSKIVPPEKTETC